VLMGGLVEAVRKHGYAMLASGPAAIPFLSFMDDPSLRRQQRFCAEVTRRGALFHPHHNWFLSAAHTPQDLAATLAMADEAFAVVKNEGVQ
jgi:glutamate-1-semialdehyde 2,1-aminomutase